MYWEYQILISNSREKLSTRSRKFQHHLCYSKFYMAAAGSASCITMGEGRLSASLACQAGDRNALPQACQFKVQVENLSLYHARMILMIL